MNKKATVCPFLSVITLNVTEINSSIKGHTLAEWIRKKKKQDPTMCGL